LFYKYMAKYVLLQLHKNFICKHVLKSNVLHF